LLSCRFVDGAFALLILVVAFVVAFLAFDAGFGLAGAGAAFVALPVDLLEAAVVVAARGAAGLPRMLSGGHDLLF
jgi:hypothetical protein